MHSGRRRPDPGERVIAITVRGRSRLGRLIPLLRTRRPPVMRRLVCIGDLEAAIDRRAREVAEAYDDPLAGEFARGIYVESARAILNTIVADEMVDDVGVRAADLVRDRGVG